ncbi:MAG: aminotransferase class V-fold PLP-dependent enzyme [Bacteroidetes bacterium]|nr:aminotransferase class V-fold PLP-dependent enzyme [Bacteroidota bacterium]
MEINRRFFLKKTVFTGALLASGIKLSAKEADTEVQGDDLWASLRDEFYLRKDRIYFNTGSLGPSPKVVVKTLNELTIELETAGEIRHELTLETNKKLAAFLNCDFHEIAVTRNATESLNSIARSLPLAEGDEVIMTKDEHVGGSQIWVALMKEKGIRIKLIDLDYSGEKNLELFRNSISSRTKVVMFSHVTCTTGMVLPAKEIVELCRSKNIYSCVDGAQAVGMIDVNLKEINPDFYAGSGHKWLLGPKGTGILYINKELLPKLNPVYAGANSDEKFNLLTQELEFTRTAQREEYGTRNTALTLAFGKSIDFIMQTGLPNIVQRTNYLASLLKTELQKNKQVELLTPLNHQYAGAIVTFRIKGKDYMQIINQLQQEFSFRVRGIYENKLNAIRICCSVVNMDDEVMKLVKAIEKLSQ